MKSSFTICVVAFLLVTSSWAEEPVDLDMVNKIRDEGFNRSEVMESLSVLADEIGPRLTASPGMRAASKWSVEQLQAWGARNEVPVVAQQPGADPAAVIYDAFESARTRGTDVVLADTAGRLQNKVGLMQELAKIVRVAERLDPAAPHEKMLVIDASLGQNAVNQAVEFNEAIGLTGITMTKLDGGGKGGVLLSIAQRLDVPFRYIGVGEDLADMDVFDAEQFAAALVEPAR